MSRDRSRRYRCHGAKRGRYSPEKKKLRVPTTASKIKSAYPIQRNDVANAVTACVTTYKRPKSLARLLASIKDHWPTLRVDVEDTRGNLSAGRNRLVARCKTPYFLLLEDDFAFTQNTRLQHFLEVLARDKTVGVVGGVVDNVGSGPYHWSHDFDAVGNVIEMLPSYRPWKSAVHCIYRHCHAVLNFGIWRTQTARETAWDESLPLNEHRPYFWDLHRAAKWRVAFCPSVAVDHYRDRPSDSYTFDRSRRFVQDWTARTGYRFKMHTARTQPERPNVVVLGVGHANTSIMTRQLAALGWQLGDADTEFAESVSCRGINKDFASTKTVDFGRAFEALRRLPQPWVIKDPRFVYTALHWLPALVPYSPTLLWVTKDTDRVVESYLTRDGDRSKEKIRRKQVKAREALAGKVFSAWPWQRIKIDASQVADAVNLFDVKRSSG